MKHKKIIDVPATTKEIVEFVTCDLCGKRIEENSFDVNEVEVRHRTGWQSPEGGNGEEVSVDVCGNCFDQKLLPWLHSQGVIPNTREWEW